MRFFMISSKFFIGYSNHLDESSHSGNQCHWSFSAHPYTGGFRDLTNKYGLSSSHLCKPCCDQKFSGLIGLLLKSTFHRQIREYCRLSVLWTSKLPTDS